MQSPARAALRLQFLVVVICVLLVGPGCSGRKADRPEKAPKAAGGATAATLPTPPPASEIVERLEDAVVFITVSDAAGLDTAVGTGCIIDASGLIATNRHVIDDAVSARIQLKDGVELPVTGVAASSESTDLAILHVEGLPDSARGFDLESVARPRVGDALLAMGHPIEFRFSVSDGILSAIRAAGELPEVYRSQLSTSESTEWLQTTAAISNGSSGGPLVDAFGELVGINTWIAPGRDLGFAVSARYLVELRAAVTLPARPLPLAHMPVIRGSETARLSAEYRDEQQRLLLALQTVDSEEARTRLLRDSPASRYLLKCRERVEDPDTPARDAVDAMILAHQIRGGERGAGDRHFAAMYAAAERLVEHDELQRIVPMLGSGPYSKELGRFLNRVQRDHPLEGVRLRACLAHVESRQDDELSAPYVPELIQLLTELRDQAGETEIAGERVRDYADEKLTFLQSLRIGTQCPPLSGRDPRGRPVKLDDFKGKVVLVDFWSDASAECQANYEHRHKLVNEFVDRPFVLLGVNCDSSPARLGTLTSSLTVPGINVYDSGTLTTDWQIETLPSNYVLDANGEIRFVDVESADLADAIQAVLEEDLFRLDEDLVAEAAEWSWYTGSEPPEAEWTSADFDDSRWSRGSGPLGYGQTGLATEIDPEDEHPTVACFRTEFEVADLSAVTTPLLRVRADDGFVVVLNGRELTRRRVPRTTTWTSRAVRPGSGEVFVEVPVERLREGRNVLAISVFQIDAFSTDLVLEVGLSSRSLDPSGVRKAKSPHTRRRFCRLASALPADAEIDALLTELAADEDRSVRVAATVARLTRAEQPSAIALPDADQVDLWFTALVLNSQVWNVVRHNGLADDDYESELSYARAMWLLAQNQGEERASLANTLGVTLYRVGRYQEALEALEKSAALGGEEPLDRIYMCLTRHKLGETDRARELFEKVRADRKSAAWAGDDDAAFAFEQEHLAELYPSEQD